MVLKDYSVEEIYLISRTKKIYFFGAGNSLKKFIDRYRERILWNSVEAIIDNDKKKQGKHYSCANLEIPIKGIEAIEDYSLVIITSVYGYDIFLQLREMRIKCECCYSKFVNAREEDIVENNREYPKNFKRTDKPMIPKIIHYCWFGKNKIPEQYLKWMESWKNYCPDYEIIRWDESNYDFSWSKYMMEAYENRKWAFVSDVARLDIIYNYGGIYLDTDVELIKPLDELLYQECYFGIENGGWVATGLGFGAIPKHRFIKELIASYENASFVKEDGKLDLTSCPIKQKKSFENLGFKFDGNYFESEDVTILPERVLCPKNLNNRSVNIDTHTFSIHHYECSWSEEAVKNAEKDVLLKNYLID